MNRLTESQVANSIVERIINGEREAEAQMVERYQRGLIFMLRHRSQDIRLAEDIAQETWRIVIEKVRNGDLKDNAKLSAFIVQTGKNQLLMFYRSSHHKRMTNEFDEDTTESQDDQPAKIVERHNNALIVRKLIKEMKTPRDQELLLRFYIKEERKEHLCEEYGLTEKHFNRVIFRARQRFKALWQEVVGV